MTTLSIVMALLSMHKCINDKKLTAKDVSTVSKMGIAGVISSSVSLVFNIIGIIYWFIGMANISQMMKMSYSSGGAVLESILTPYIVIGNILMIIGFIVSLVTEICLIVLHIKLMGSAKASWFGTVSAAPYIRCPRCGNTIPANTEYCIICGIKLH